MYGYLKVIHVSPSWVSKIIRGDGKYAGRYGI